MISEISAIRPRSEVDSKGPLQSVLRRVGFDGGLMPATGDVRGKHEEDHQGMSDDWAGALPDVHAASGQRRVPEQGDPRTMEPSAGRMPRTLTSPIRPSAEDVGRHYITHMPPMSWCPICSAANLREDPHKKVDHSEDDRRTGLPTISLDYAETQIGTDKEENKRVVKTVVMKDEVSGAVVSHRTIQKGPGDEWLMKRLVRDIKGWSRNDVFIKTDGVPVMVAASLQPGEQRRLREGRAGRGQTTPGHKAGL